MRTALHRTSSGSNEVLAFVKSGETSTKPRPETVVGDSDGDIAAARQTTWRRKPQTFSEKADHREALDGRLDQRYQGTAKQAAASILRDL